VSLIEWFEYLPADAVDEFLELRIAHAGRSKRELKFVAHGERYEQLLETLRNVSCKHLKVRKFADRTRAKGRSKE
jgi:hypothetical protein